MLENDMDLDGEFIPYEEIIVNAKDNEVQEIINNMLLFIDSYGKLDGIKMVKYSVNVLNSYINGLFDKE